MLSEKCIGVVVRGARTFCEGDMAALSVRQPIMESRPARTRTITTLDTVRRNLFGCSDSEENRRFLKRELALQLELDSQRWGFDFAKGVPLPGPQDFSWQMVAAQSVPATLRTQPVPKPNPPQESKAPSPDANKTQKRITDFLKPRKRLTTSGKKSPAGLGKHECGHGAHIRPPKVARLAPQHYKRTS